MAKPASNFAVGNYSNAGPNSGGFMIPVPNKSILECGGTIAGGVAATLAQINTMWNTYKDQLTAAQQKIEKLADTFMEQGVSKAEAFAQAAADVAAESASEGALVEVLGALVAAIGGWEAIGILALAALGAAAVAYVVCTK